MIYIKKLLQ